MITAEELIEDYMEHYECDRMTAVDMILEDIELVVKELNRMKTKEEAKSGNEDKSDIKDC